MNSIIRYDYTQLTRKDYSYLHFQYSLMKNRGLRLVYYFRKTSLSNFIIRPVFRLFYNHLSKKMNIEIPLGTQIGKGFTLGHPSGIVINPKSIIGDDVSISHAVTIGEVKSGKRKGTPVIGNHVYIGAKATIVGGISIGNDVLIAANSFVDFDVPDDSLVIGNPGIIKPKMNACTKDYH